MDGDLDRAANAVKAASNMLNGEPIAAAGAIVTAAQDVERYVGLAVQGTSDAVGVALGSGAMLGGRMANGWTQGAETVNQTGLGILQRLQQVMEDAATMASQIGDLSSTMEEDSEAIRHPGGAS